MLSAADHKLTARDPALIGLPVLLDAQATTRLIESTGVVVDGQVQIEYLRYKPGRRCISLVRLQEYGQEQRFVLTAFAEFGFESQRAKTAAMSIPEVSWQNDRHRIRIDRFPFDPGLRHVSKCFEPDSRQRLLRRTLGRHEQPDRFTSTSLAYKPGRRYVASGTPADTSSTAIAEPKYTLKFYSGSHFHQTLQRLQTVHSINVAPPKIVGSNEHYRLIILEWQRGKLLAEAIGEGTLENSLLFETGCYLARLHRSRPPCSVCPAAAPHELQELADYISFLNPELELLATQAASETQFQIANTSAPTALIHGDFYDKQVLVDQGRVNFIDFDQAGLGNPYQDIGNFVAKLHWQRAHLGLSVASIEQDAEIFLDGYRRVAHNFDQRAYRASLAAGLIRCATHPFRRAQQAWEETTQQLLSQALRVLHSSVQHLNTAAAGCSKS